MRNKWDDAEAARYVSEYVAKGFNEDIALRVYTSRLLGRESALVLHGGGNTSVKTTQTNILNEEVRVLCVKGSGWDMADIEPTGLPAVMLDPLLKTRALTVLSDEEMVRYQRANLLDFQAPNPSIETLLHAYFPHKFVDHTHANAILAVINQENPVEICREIFGNKMGIVPYVKPGFLLAKAAADVYEQDPSVEGLILLNHGIFTFADSAKEAYDRMIKYVTLAEEYIALKAKQKSALSVVVDIPWSVHELAPIIRGACSYVLDKQQGTYHRFLMTFRTNEQILRYMHGADVARYSQTGVVTPDHIIRTKNYPLLLPVLNDPDIENVKATIQNAVANYAQKYDAYFVANNPKNNPKTRLDPMPRVILVPGLGLFALGNTLNDANIVADIAENTIQTILDAEAVGKYVCLKEPELFEMEYWSLEQAKLKSAKSLPLSGQIAVITGGAGTIGIAVAKLLQAQGATVALLDVDGDKLQAIQGTLRGGSIALQCNVTDQRSVQDTYSKILKAFGGVDILVSNAGAAWQGAIATVADSVMRESFELNFFAHQYMAQTAVQIMLQQNTGGVLLFNVSKQAIDPGKNFGPYGIAKAATLALVRQYALEYGEYGIRSNAVNADRIRSGLLTDDMISQRSKARNLDTVAYMAGNLLRREVQADDVAQAFLQQILATKTTAHVMTVDGGNMAAALR